MAEPTDRTDKPMAAQRTFHDNREKFLARDRLNLIWVIGDSTAGDYAKDLWPTLKIMLGREGYMVEFMGTEQAAVSDYVNPAGRGIWYDSIGGATPAQIAEEVASRYATAKAAFGEPDVILCMGNHNETGGAVAAENGWTDMLTAILATANRAHVLVNPGLMLASGNDSVQESRHIGLARAVRKMQTGASALNVGVMPSFQFTSQMGDSQTDDGTHNSWWGIALNAILCTAYLIGESPMEVWDRHGSACEILNGPGGDLALWCMASENAGALATVELEIWTGKNRVGGRGVANADNQAYFSVVNVPAAGATLKSLLTGVGGFEQGVTKARILNVAGGDVYIWKGGRLDGSDVEVPLATVKPVRVQVGNYRLVTAAGAPPEVWLD